MFLSELFPLAPVQTEDLNEGWKETLAKGAVTGAIALGANLTTPTQHADKLRGDQRASVVVPFQNGIENKVIQPLVGNEFEINLKREAASAGIKGIELAQFMAQCFVESFGFKHLIELGGKDYFKKYDIKHRPRKARSLGNVKVGDGERYKGRGFIQITGRYNYRIAGKELGIPLEENPELAADPAIAAKVAVWYWNKKVSPSINDFKDTTTVTKHINSGLAGLDRRKKAFDAYFNTLRM